MNLETELQNDLEDLGLDRDKALEVIALVRDRLRPPDEKAFLDDQLDEITAYIEDITVRISTIRKQVMGL